MSLDAFVLPAFLVLFALASFTAFPPTSMAMSKLPLEISSEDADTSGGQACNLPPTLELDEREGVLSSNKVPPLDTKVAGNFQTATFAMG